VLLFRLCFGSVRIPGYVRGSVIAIAVGIAPIYAAQNATGTSHCCRFGAFGLGCGMGFYASDTANSPRLLLSLVILVHRRHCRHHFILLAIWRDFPARRCARCRFPFLPANTECTEDTVVPNRRLMARTASPKPCLPPGCNLPASPQHRPSMPSPRRNRGRTASGPRPRRPPKEIDRPEALGRAAVICLFIGEYTRGLHAKGVVFTH